MRPVTLLLTLLILSSAFAGYLYITQERVGTGTRFTLNWAQGWSSYSAGPASCWASRPPGDATYILPSSDDTGPSTPDYTQNCAECDCNNGLGGKEDYTCRADGTCKRCPPCPPSGCGFGEKCDTSSGTCNSQCVCDPVTCKGSYCVGDDVYTYGCSGDSCRGSFSKTCPTGCVNTGSGSIYYSGCSGGSCDSGTSYPCPNCKEKVTTCVYYKCDQNGENCQETGRDVGANCPPDCGYTSGGATYTCKEIQTCP